MKAVSVADVVEARSRRAVARNPMEEGSKWRGREYIQWPRQGPVPQKDWALWKQAVTRIAKTARHSEEWELEQVSVVRAENGRKLWTREGPREWAEWRSKEGMVPGMERYQRTQRASSEPPEGGRAVFVREIRQEIHVVGTGGRVQRSQSKSDKRLSRAEKQWLEAVAAGEAVVSTDGSFKNGRSTAAYSLNRHGRRKGLVTAAAEVQGRKQVQSAYRAELGGILQALRRVESIIRRDRQCHDIAGKTVVVACDNKMAGIHAVQYTQDVGTAVQHFDILREIRGIQSGLPVRLRYKHVYGHQLERDRGVARDEFAFWNDEVDKQAGEAQSGATQCRDSEEGGNEWSVWLDGEKVCTRVTETLRRYVQGQRTTGWQRKVGRIRKEQMSAVDVQAARLAMGQITTRRRQWVAKHACSFGPVGRNMHKWKFWATNLCPICGQCEETTDHVMQCQHPTAVAVRRAAMKEWETGLLAGRGSGLMVRELVRQVGAWCDGLRLEGEQGPQLSKAVAEQASIGWNMMVRGRWSKKWGLMQEQMMELHEQPGTAANWIARAIVGLWEVRWKAWEARNKVLHESESGIAVAKLTREAARAVRKEWRKGVGNLTGDDARLLTLTTEAAVRRQSAANQLTWVKHVQAARAASARRKRKRSDSTTTVAGRARRVRSRR